MKLAKFAETHSFLLFSNGLPFQRVLYGVRKVASRVNDGIDPDFGNHTVVLV